MNEPTPRQVLYALVAVGFLLVVALLTIGAAAAGLVPRWWSITMVALVGGAGVWAGFNWRRTASFLMIAIGAFVAWTIGTLLLIP